MSRVIPSHKLFSVRPAKHRKKTRKNKKAARAAKSEKFMIIPFRWNNTKYTKYPKYPKYLAQYRINEEIINTLLITLKYILIISG